MNDVYKMCRYPYSAAAAADGGYNDVARKPRHAKHSWTFKTKYDKWINQYMLVLDRKKDTPSYELTVINDWDHLIVPSKVLEVMEDDWPKWIASWSKNATVIACLNQICHSFIRIWIYYITHLNLGSLKNYVKYIYIYYIYISHLQIFIPIPEPCKLQNLAPASFAMMVPAA